MNPTASQPHLQACAHLPQIKTCGYPIASLAGRQKAPVIPPLGCFQIATDFNPWGGTDLLHQLDLSRWSANGSDTSSTGDLERHLHDGARPGQGIARLETVGEDPAGGQAEGGLLVGVLDAGEAFAADEIVRDEVSVVVVSGAENAVGADADGVG